MTPISEKISYLVSAAEEEADMQGRTIEFPFTAEQVVRVYTQKTHPDYYGDGLWFQISGGKVFNCLGQQEHVRKSYYSEPIENEAARVIAAYVIARLKSFKPTDYSGGNDL